MSRSPDESPHYAVSVMRGWLSGDCSRCRFASVFAKGIEHDPRINYYTAIEDVASEDFDAIESWIDATAEQEHVAVVIFPRLNTAGDIADIISRLADRDRWTAERVEWEKHARVDATGIGLAYRTHKRHYSESMGLAPLLEMPPTRRAPYIALALWAGGFANTLSKVKAKGRTTVNLADAAHPLKRETHDNMWDETKDDVAESMRDPPQDVRWMRRVSFVLPTEVVEERLSNVPWRAREQAPAPAAS